MNESMLSTAQDHRIQLKDTIGKHAHKQVRKKKPHSFAEFNASNVGIQGDAFSEGWPISFTALPIWAFLSHAALATRPIIRCIAILKVIEDSDAVQ